MTRARDLVVLSGAGGDRKPAEWRAEIEKLIADNEDARQLLRRVPYAELEKAAVELDGRIRSFRDGSTALEPLFEVVTRLYPGAIPAPRILRFPATTLSSYHNDPEEFAKTKWASFDPFPSRPRRFAGDAEPAGDDIPPPRDTDEVGSTADFGTAGHAVLEQLASNGWRGDVAALAEASGVENHLSARDISDLKTRLARAVDLDGEDARELRSPADRMAIRDAAGRGENTIDRRWNDGPAVPGRGRFLAHHRLQIQRRTGVRAEEKVRLAIEPVPAGAQAFSERSRNR